MGLRAALVRPFARAVARSINRWAAEGLQRQEQTLRLLVERARDTAFGRDHDFQAIRGYADFSARVPIRDYEELKPYIERIKRGENDVLWPGKPRFLPKLLALHRGPSISQ